MFSLFFAILTVSLLVTLVVIPKYLEFRKVLGIDRIWSKTGTIPQKIQSLFWGLRTQVLGLFTVICIALPSFLDLGRSLDLEAVVSHDTARFISFWLALGSGLLTVFSNSFGMLSAAKAKPAE